MLELMWDRFWGGCSWIQQNGRMGDFKSKSYYEMFFNDFLEEMRPFYNNWYYNENENTPVANEARMLMDVAANVEG